MKERSYIAPEIIFVATEIISKTDEYITLAFSHGSREKILKRDGYRCVVCGATEHLEAAHVDHSRDKWYYDKPSNGRTLCTEHHLEDHIIRAGHNGLAENHNNWAIKSIEERLRIQRGGAYLQSHL